MRWVAIGWAAAVLASSAAADDRLRVDVTDPTGRGYQVAIQRFALDDAGQDPLREELYTRLVSGVEYSGLLRVVDPSAFLGPRETLDWGAEQLACDNWRGIGADALVQGRIEPLGGGRVRLHFRIWDTVRCSLQGDPAWFEGEASSLGYLARRVADELIWRFTGRRGVSATQIAFVSDQSGNKELYVMEADGSGKRRVTGNGSINLFPSWSPDGATLLYTSYRGGIPEVWMISRGRGRNGRLLDSPAAKLRAVWAPIDGQIAVVISDAENTDLYTVGANGRGLRRVTYGRSIEVAPSWSPDGRRIAFMSDQSGSPQIYVRDLDSGETRRLTYKGDYNASPSWSPSGEWIAFSARTGTNFDIYLIDPESGYTRPIVLHPRADEDPHWSPDGRKLAFVSSRYGRKEVFSVDLNGENLRRLTEGFGNCSNPAWSPWLD